MNRFLKLALVLVFVSLASANIAEAKKNNNLGGGFSGTMPNTISVQEALKAKDDTFIGLEGKIVKALGDEEYLFSDGKNQIMIEIDDDIWRGLTVSEQDTIIIYGTIDKDIMEDAKLDAEKIVKK